MEAYESELMDEEYDVRESADAAESTEDVEKIDAPSAIRSSKSWVASRTRSIESASRARRAYSASLAAREAALLSFSASTAV